MTSSAPIAVGLKGVVKRFGEAVAVDGISLEVPDERFYALLGPSGCGKTTTLRMIAGFEQPTEGRIELFGEDVTGRKPYQRPVNTVFQSYALFPHLSVFENIAFGLRRKKVAESEINAKVTKMLDLVQLQGMERRKPDLLSGGQAQRVALARALINEPDVLLLDEPLGALDLKLRREMQTELKRIQQEVGIAFIHVTHDQEEAMTMADTIAVMNKGKIERLGAPITIYDDPRTSFVAGFLGASNLMDGAAEIGMVVLADGTRLAVHNERLSGFSGAVKVGVRPEKMRLFSASEPVPYPNRLEGEVTDVSFIGVSTQYLVRTRAMGEMAVVVQNLEAHRFQVEDQVVLGWPAEYTFVVRDTGLPDDDDQPG